MASDCLLLAAIVLGVNLLPAFGPPTWAVLVLFRLETSIPGPLLVAIGLVAAGSGRLVLALASRRLAGRLSARRRESLDAARSALAERRARGAAALGLFLVSPLPSAQLFVAAGLLRAPLPPLLGAWLAGRLVSYSLYVSAASLADRSLGGIVRDSLTEPLGIALQVAMVVLVVLLLRVDWARRLAGRGRSGARPGV